MIDVWLLQVLFTSNKDRCNNNIGDRGRLVNIPGFEVATTDWDLAAAWERNWVQCRYFSHAISSVLLLQVPL